MSFEEKQKIERSKPTLSGMSLPVLTGAHVIMAVGNCASCFTSPYLQTVCCIATVPLL